MTPERAPARSRGSEACNETGVVTVCMPDGRVAVRVSRSEACQGCSSKSACNTLGGDTKDVVLVVKNELNAQPGDRVQLAMAEANVLKASAALYLLPALALMAGAGLGWQLAPLLAWGRDPASMVGAALGLLTGLLGTRILSKRLSRTERFAPRIRAVLGPAAGSGPVCRPE